MRPIRFIIFSIFASAVILLTFTAITPEAKAQACTTAPLDLMCPSGEVLRGIQNDGTKLCVTPPSGGGAGGGVGFDYKMTRYNCTAGYIRIASHSHGTDGEDSVKLCRSEMPMKFFTGTGCSDCPYGVKSAGGKKFCKFKEVDGSLNDQNYILMRPSAFQKRYSCETTVPKSFYFSSF